MFLRKRDKIDRGRVRGDREVGEDGERDREGEKMRDQSVCSCAERGQGENL